MSCKFCGQDSCNCEDRIRSKVEERVLRVSTKLGRALNKMAKAEILKYQRK